MIPDNGRRMTASNSLRIYWSGLLEWYQGGGMRSFPWRESTDPYAVLVGEVLLQRTRGEHVIPVYEEFLRRWPTYENLGKARTTTIASVIRPLGLAKRAPLLKRLGRALTELGDVPSTAARLEDLPGVGPYTAHAVPVFASGANMPVVDWVIARVLRRYLGLPGERRPNADNDLWRVASELAEMGRARDLWLGTLDFAASVCKPRPLCGHCPLSNECHYYQSLESVGVGS